MKQLVIAAFLFLAPIVGVMTVNPVTAKKCVADAQAWARKTFPTPKPTITCRPQRG